MLKTNAWRRGRAQPRQRHEVGRMNKTEEAYAQHLELRRQAGEINAFAFEPLKLRLANRTWYSIDFLVQFPDGTLQAHEVKGHMEDDAAVKLKVAAEQHPWLFFILVKKDGQRWAQTEI